MSKQTLADICRDKAGSVDLSMRWRDALMAQRFSAGNELSVCHVILELGWQTLSFTKTGRSLEMVMEMRLARMATVATGSEDIAFHDRLAATH